MKFFIDSNALERLNHPKLETRQNALREITSIMKNNILVEERNRNPYAQEEFGVVNLDALTRQLIRWFQYKPITNEVEIFDLLIMIFSREDFLRHITQSMSLQRLKKEMMKISRLLMPEESSEKLNKIDELLKKFEYGLLIDVANETGSFLEQHPVLTTSIEQQSENSFIDRMQKLMISPAPKTNSNCDKEEKEDIDNKHYEFWINLDGSNLETFNFIDSQLLLYNDKKHIKNVLKFLCVTISDYPAEFFLQPPNVLETFIDILPKVNTENALEILKFVHFIINGLKQRYIEAKKQNLQYMPIKKHMNKVIQMFTNFFETFNDNCLDIHLELQQQRLNSIYLILFDMVDLVDNTEDVCDIYLNEMLNMIAKVVRGFRLIYVKSEPNSDMYRFNYIVLIYLINAFVSRINVENITKYSENNLWEFESDLALLDWTLQHSHPQIYNLIKSNRMEVIKDDKDMNLLLNISATWKPVVDLFQNWKNITDESIIYKGLKCLDTIRIHKSVELVDLLFPTILRCAEQFNTMSRLKKAAEEIVLRLLSNEVLEIRLKAYSMARESVQKKLGEDHDEKLKNVDLCAIIGIPISTEIVTEVLCFGYCDENEDIYKQAKLILFALLRAKVVFPNHWAKILEMIRPVLPLVPCLFKTDHKLGFFSFDIFHKHSGFEESELNQAFARFMFCSHPKAREMAKIKLLENLKDPDLTQDFIEIIPDNFCVLPDNQVSDLQMPDKSVKYNPDSYEIIKNLFLVINTIKDEAVIQSILVQLSVQMNSSELCQKSHNDNIWVYFVAKLDMGHPKSSVIRKLVINILYKWAVTISSFRIYLSNEPKVMEFLIKTLIYFQDDLQIKTQASSLLFLLAFSDFIVTNEKTISLPKFLKNLQCPFKFEVHWTESPFNKVTQLEWLFEALEIQNENMDVQEITLRYLRYTFGAVWFKNLSGADIMSCTLTSDDYYKSLNSVNALKLPKSLILTGKDNEFKRDTAVNYITSNISHAFETVKTVRDLERQISKISCLMMIPSMNVNTFVMEMVNRMGKYIQYADDHCDVQKSMLVKCIELYQNLFIPWMSPETIIPMLLHDPFMLVFKKTNQIDENVYIQMLNFINAVVKECESNKLMSENLIINFNKHHKIHFSSNLIEKLCEHLFDVAMKDKSWNDVTKVPSVKAIYTLIRNVLRIMPIELDEKYVNVLFGKFIEASRGFLKAKKKNEKSGLLNTYIINQIFAAVEALTSLKYNFTVNDEHYSTLFLWIKESDKVDKALIWSIIANLTQSKDSYDKFCEGFKNELDFSVFDMIFERIFADDVKSNYEQKALTLVIGNILDNSSNPNELKVSINKQQMKIIIKFLDQKQISYETMSFLVKKMIQNKVPDTAKIVKQRRILEKVLDNAVENLDMITMCHSYDELKDHVIEVVSNISDKRLRDLLISLENPTSVEAIKAKKCLEYKRNNNNILNILLMLISSSSGIDRIRKIFVTPNLTESLTLAIFSGLKTSNTPNEIAFHIKFLITFLNAYKRNNYDISTSLFGCQSTEFKCSKTFKKINEDLGAEKAKPEDAFFESHFMKILHASDLFLLQAVSIFNYADNLKQAEWCYQIRLTAFVFIRSLLNESNRAKTFAAEIKLQEWITNKTESFINNPINMLTNSYSEAVKKNGAPKCKYVIRNLCVLLKAISEWNLPAVSNSKKTKELFEQLKKIFTWIEADKILLNTFYQFIQHISQLDIIKVCITQEINGISVIKGILQKVQKETQKIPHAESNLVLIQNGLFTIEKCSHMVDVRFILKNAKIFQILDILHPQIQLNKKTTWNDVTEMWLDFFDVLSRYEDCECSPGQISLLCRIVRIGNQSMKSSALKIIRNLSMNSSLGYVVLISDEFMETIQTILSDDSNKDDMLFTLETLLSIATKSEQSRSKLKNSSFYGKLRDHLISLEFPIQSRGDAGFFPLLGLTSMLKDVLCA